MDPQNIGLPAETSSPSLGEQTAALRQNFETLPMGLGLLDIDHLIVWQTSQALLGIPLCMIRPANG